MSTTTSRTATSRTATDKRSTGASTRSNPAPVSDGNNANPALAPANTASQTAPVRSRGVTSRAPFVERLALALDVAVGRLAYALTRWSVPALRVSLGLVFLGFGALKLLPGASPAADIASRTIDALTFGLVNGNAAVYLTAVLEVFIGVTLLTGKFLKTGLVVLAGAFVGILSPTVLFADELFGDGMTLLGQYVLKDIVLVAGAAVVAAAALGARLRRS